MKVIFDYIIKNVPQSFVFAILAVTLAYFAIYYHYSYKSYGDAFRDPKFRSAAIVILAFTLLYVVNKHPTESSNTDLSPLLIVPKFQNDTDDKCRSPFVAIIESRLDGTLGRPGTVQKIRSFVMEAKSAEYTLEEYGAIAILYDVSVSDFGGNQVVCFKVFTRESGPLERFPPVPVKDPLEEIDRLVINLAGEVSRSGLVADKNPLLGRLLEIENRLDQLELLSAAQEIRLGSDQKFPSYRNRYAIIVGVDKFEGSQSSLRFSKSDARQFAQLLSDSYGFTVTMLLDEEAKKPAILAAIKSVSEKAKQEDLFVFCFIGRGTEVMSKKSPTGKVATIVPYDFRWESNNLTILELLNELGQVPARHRLLMIDACHSTSGVLPNTSPRQLDADPSESVIQVFGASRDDETSHEGPNGSVFMQALIRVLSQSASQHEDGIWMSDVYSRIRSIVTEQGFSQTAQLLRVSGNGEIAWCTKK